MNKHNLKSGLLFATIGVVVVVVFTTALAIAPAVVFGEGEIHPALGDLAQWDGSTRIPEGWVMIGSPRAISFSADIITHVNAPEGKLQVELRQFEKPFTGNDNNGGILTSDLVPAGEVARVTKADLSVGKYHWRARAIDSMGNTSDWQEFGAAGNVDFEIRDFATLITPPRGEQSLGVSVGNLPPNGSPNAKITIIEYGNYYDGFSRMFFKTTEQQLRAEYIETGKVAMYWKDFTFPGFDELPGNPNAANAARCANEQGMFWQYHDSLFSWLDSATEWGRPMKQTDFESIGEQLGLDMTRFSQCLDAERYLPLIEADSQNAAREGINAVPTFFINGRLVIGAWPFDEFKRIIDEELAKLPRTGKPWTNPL
ncbi:MAG: thioredoxin domain-containing protein [Parcubacteria group bacterium]